MNCRSLHPKPSIFVVERSVQSVVISAERSASHDEVLNWLVSVAWTSEVLYRVVSRVPIGIIAEASREHSESYKMNVGLSIDRQ